MANNIVIDGGRIIFRNFSGKPTRFTKEGVRTFCLVLDNPEYVEMLKEDGWNVKTLPPRNPDDDPLNYISVSVNYDNFPPKIYLVTSQKKTLLDEDTVSVLDYAELAHVDLVIRPYTWEVNGKSGVKAYLKTMYATVVEDEFENKYRDLTDEEEEVPFN